MAEVEADGARTPDRDSDPRPVSARPPETAQPVVSDDTPPPDRTTATSTPPTAESEAARAERTSDAHDPEARAAWIGLLSFLSDDELARYGEIARDQLDQEWQRGFLQALGGITGLALMAGAAAALIWGWVALWLAASVAIVGCAIDVWAWKKVKARRLWRSHIRAVADEQARRRADTTPEANAA
ncbi:MAG: hypothetical protein AAGG99_07520, partial [Pseudomonadota bacterium]